VRPWLLGITTNLSRNATRSLRRYRAVFDRIPPLRPEEDFADDLAERLDAQAKADAFRAAIARLPRRERDALALECEGLTPTEIAVALQTKATNVRVRLFRARRRLTDGQPRAMPDTHVPTRGAETP
jgi:RNA polymerase sigma-70 factor (ECF subfamily)